MKGTNRQVVAAWISGEHDKGSNPKGSLYFDGDIIYSYTDTFPIGRLVWDTEGYQPVAAITTAKRYAQTTSTHQGLVSVAAARNLVGGAIEICKFPNEVTLPVANEYIERTLLAG